MKRKTHLLVALACLSSLLLVQQFVFPPPHARAISLFSYGEEYPYGLGAVNYIYGPDGTWKNLTNVQYLWNYYSQWATSAHPYNRSALIAYANGTHQTTARDANGHLLLDFNHDGEIDVSSGGSAFEEHNGKGAGNATLGTPFSNFWFDDNWLARYMAQAYHQPEPYGLSQYSDFTRWQIIGGDTSHWTPYGSNFYDTLALDGLYYLASGNSATALSKWQTMLGNSGYTYDSANQRYTYPNITQNYYLGLFEILTNKLILSGDFSGSTLTQLIQHSVSLRSIIISNQEKSGPNLYGWITDIGSSTALMNTETIACNVLGLGSGGYAAYEAGHAPLDMSSGGNYFVRSYSALSAVTGLSSPGYMTYGPYQHFATGTYTVDYYLRAPAPTGTMAHLDIYDSNSGQILAQTSVTAAQMATKNQWTRISLPVTVSNASISLELRTWWYGTANMDVAYIQVR